MTLLNGQSLVAAKPFLTTQSHLATQSPGGCEGFSLLEVSVVLLIMGLLLGSLLQPFGASMTERKRQQTEQQLYLIREATIGFAAANHRLPCPINMAGETGDICIREHGYVPAATLGIDGRFDENGLLIDSWGNPIRYSVTATDVDDNGQADFTTTAEMQRVGIQYLQPKFRVCEDSSCKRLRASQVPIVVYSTGQLTLGSNDEKENIDGDNRFVSRTTDTAGADQFDDIVVWLSENILYSRLIQAGVLP